MTEPTQEQNYGVTFTPAWLCITLVLLGAWALQWPSAADLKLFALYDPGSALRADALVAQGLKPGVDFGFSYGLVPLLIGRGWLGAFGRTPVSYLAYMAVMQLAIGASLAYLVAALRLRWWSFVSLLLALPIAIMPTYLHFTHPLEVTLIVLALALQARGRFAWALVVLTACVFVKPSMALIFGAIVTAQILWLQRGIVKQLWPAAATGAALAVLLLWIFGGASLLATTVPVGASQSYREANFGFFTGIGRLFWWPESPSVGYYLLTPAGIWLAATLVMLVMMWRSHPTRTSLATITALHLAFMGLFFGYPGSWQYYAYLPMLGLAIVLAQRQSRAACVVVDCLVVLALSAQFGSSYNGWRFKESFGGTSAYASDRADVTQAIAATQGRRHLWLTNGYIEHFAPGVTTPPCWFMSPGLQKPREIESLRQQITSAEVVVTHNQTGPLNPWLFPALRDATSAFVRDPVASNQTFTIWRRQAASQPGP